MQCAWDSVGFAQAHQNEKLMSSCTLDLTLDESTERNVKIKVATYYANCFK